VWALRNSFPYYTLAVGFKKFLPHHRHFTLLHPLQFAKQNSQENKEFSDTFKLLTKSATANV
jgi:hypothetical protein